MNCSRSEHRETVDGWMDGWRTDPKEMSMNGAQWLTSTALGWLSELFFYPATIPVDKDLDMIILLLTLLLLGCVQEEKPRCRAEIRITTIFTIIII